MDTVLKDILKLVGVIILSGAGLTILVVSIIQFFERRKRRKRKKRK